MRDRVSGTRDGFGKFSYIKTQDITDPDRSRLIEHLWKDEEVLGRYVALKRLSSLTETMATRKQ